MDKITHQVRIEQWTNIINECLASGMNKTAWCKQNGISDKAFFYWQRIIRKEIYCTAELPAPSEFSKDSLPKASFVELRTESSVSADALNNQTFRPDTLYPHARPATAPCRSINNRNRSI